MEDKKNKSNYSPDINNYDYVWGSDQDEYSKDKQSAEADASPKQVNDDSTQK